MKNSRAAAGKCTYSDKGDSGTGVLSSPAVTARIERLESKGIIKGYHAAVDSVNLGYKIKAFVNLDLEPVQKEEFYPFIESVENVIECNCVTGEYSMLIEVEFLNTEELDDFINNLQKFGKTSTQIVFPLLLSTEACLYIQVLMHKMI